MGRPPRADSVRSSTIPASTAIVRCTTSLRRSRGPGKGLTGCGCTALSSGSRCSSTPRPCVPRSTPSPSRHGACIRRGHRATRRSCSSGSEVTPTATALSGPMAATPHLDRLPYVRRVLAALGASIGRTRLMRIATETELDAHVDTNYYWWNHLRLHVPVATTPDVAFQAGDETVHMAAGEAWVFDTWQRHRVDNPAASPRIHLVVDTVGSAALWDLINRPTQPARRITPDDGAAPSIAVEQWNWPAVMSPAEVDATIGVLVDEVGAVDPASADRADQCLAPFRRDWRDLHARFGPAPGGLEARRTLLRTTGQLVRGELDGIELPNGVVLAHALQQLVLGPALSPHVAEPPQRAAAGPVRGAPAALAGPARIVNPVFVVCPPRSGSSFLFETLQRSPTLATIGGESHELIEGIASLTPAAHNWNSNRLDGRGRDRGCCRAPQGALRDAPAQPSRPRLRTDRRGCSRRLPRTLCGSRSWRTRSRTRGSCTSTEIHEKRFRACSTPGVRAGS